MNTKNLPDDLQRFLNSPWLDWAEAHLAGIHLDDTPIYFIVLYGSDRGQQTIDPAIEGRRSRIIQKIAQDAKVTTVFCEGFDGEASAIPQDRDWADRRMAAGQMKGEDHAQTVCPVPIRLVGIDNMRRYHESARALAKLQEKSAALEEAISVIAGIMAEQQKRCSGRLRDILVAKEAYRDSRMTLSEYSKFLLARADKASIVFQDWDPLKRFVEVLCIEANIDMAAVAEELALIQELGPSLSDPSRWMLPSLRAFGSVTLPEDSSFDTMAEQAVEIVNGLQNSPGRLRRFTESQLYRTAMYGAKSRGHDGMERTSPSVDEYSRAISDGMRWGPKSIAALMEKELKGYNDGQHTTNELLNFVIDLAAFAELGESRIPTLTRYAQYRNLYAAVPTAPLFKSISKIEKRLVTDAVVTQADRMYTAALDIWEEWLCRTRLTLPGTKAGPFAEEEPARNCARALVNSPALRAASADLVKNLDVLDGAESLARCFYAGSVPRGNDMARKLQEEVLRRRVWGSVVSIGGFHCASIVSAIREDPHASYVVILPTAGRELPLDRTDWDIFDNGTYQEPDQGEEELFEEWEDPGILNYRSLTDPGVTGIEDLPRMPCANVLCRFSGPAVVDRVVCFEPPGSRATFYCATCRKFYCGLELERVAVPPEVLHLLPEDSVLARAGEATNREPFSLSCRHCGKLVGQGPKAVILPFGVTTEKGNRSHGSQLGEQCQRRDTGTTGHLPEDREEGQLDAARKEVEQIERLFRAHPAAETAYELGESYDRLLALLRFGRENLSQRKAVKRRLLGLLRWMSAENIQLGEAYETLKALEIEFDVTDHGSK